MQIITIHKAKSQLSQLIAKACGGEEIIIARDSEPVVRLVAIKKRSANRKPGAWKGKVKVGPEFFEPLPAKDLDRWE